MCVCMCVCTWTWVVSAWLCVCVCVCVCTHIVYACAYVCLYVCVYLCVCGHTSQLSVAATHNDTGKSYFSCIYTHFVKRDLHMYEQRQKRVKPNVQHWASLLQIHSMCIRTLWQNKPIKIRGKKETYILLRVHMFIHSWTRTHTSGYGNSILQERLLNLLWILHGIQTKHRRVTQPMKLRFTIHDLQLPSHI